MVAARRLPGRRRDARRSLGLRLQFAESAVENAPRPVVVMQLCAIHHPPRSPANQGGKLHREYRRGEINPQTSPNLPGKRGAESARRIHAHAGERSLASDERRDEKRRTARRVAGEPRVIADIENREHQHKRGAASIRYSGQCERSAPRSGERPAADPPTCAAALSPEGTAASRRRAGGRRDARPSLFTASPLPHSAARDRYWCARRDRACGHRRRPRRNCAVARVR